MGSDSSAAAAGLDIFEARMEAVQNGTGDAMEEAAFASERARRINRLDTTVAVVQTQESLNVITSQFSNTDEPPSVASARSVLHRLLRRHRRALRDCSLLVWGLNTRAHAGWCQLAIRARCWPAHCVALLNKFAFRQCQSPTTPSV
ncbi:unnamed protein product [Prorocentrum cordatum]|uniref:Uncharacterized protein n=1 Tax=Prorocentrum cordatum TaxID=2364126 RepID=A0ABN9TL23_9DINO|nr:unnamed protein product [Polarella glacialis]